MNVLDMQLRLASLGFDPGPADGKSGPRTVAAVRAFQASAGLQVDGVAGPKTLAALARAEVPKGPAAPAAGGKIGIDRTVLFARLRAKGSGLFGTSLSPGQVRGIEGILDAFDDVGDGRAGTLAYALATAYHETGRRMVPVREGFATTDAGARRAVDALARTRGPSSAVAKYARPAGPYGHVYYGRGHVQMTWLTNYAASSADAGVDLIKDPDAMLDPVISARVLIRGLLDGRWNGAGKGLRFYLDAGDLKNARRTVNGTDKAAEIAGYHRSFLAAIDAARAAG